MLKPYKTFCVTQDRISKFYFENFIKESEECREHINIIISFLLSLNAMNRLAVKKVSIL